MSIHSLCLSVPHQPAPLSMSYADRDKVEATGLSLKVPKANTALLSQGDPEQVPWQRPRASGCH